MKTAKAVLILMLGAGLVFSVLIPFGYSQQSSAQKSTAASQCPKGQVWELPHVRPDGEKAEGFCRPAVKEDFRWVPARKDSADNLQRGYWMPAKRPPADQYWVRGHYENDGKWVEGYFITRRVSPSRLFGSPSGAKKSGESGSKLFGR